MYGGCGRVSECVHKYESFSVVINAQLHNKMVPNHNLQNAQTQLHTKQKDLEDHLYAAQKEKDSLQVSI